VSISKDRARQFAEHILREHESRSYRQIAKEDFPCSRADGTQIVKAGTLNRIAKTKGEWLPKDQEILVALGLKELKVKEPLPAWIRQAKRLIARMAKETREAIKWK